jgi:hypothetical protein
MGGGERKSNEPLDVRLVDPNLKYIFEHNNSLSIVHCGGYLHSIYEKQKKKKSDFNMTAIQLKSPFF